MHIQDILKKKPSPNQHQIENLFDQKSILYKYQNNGEWKKVQPEKPERQKDILLNKNYIPQHKPQPLSKQFQKDRPMFIVLHEFQKFRVYNKILGSGTYSKVFLGENKRTKQFVAVKRVEELQQNQIACLMNSQSKYIIKMHDFWNSGKFSYIVLQLCQTNLREILHKISTQEKIQYFQQIIQGMDYLNRKKIIHRDLKFENILIKDKTIKISDFGFAKPIGSKLSVISVKCGTPYTMAPQIYFFKGQGKPLYTHKCDIYSLGVILHQLLYQKHPFDYCDKSMQNNKRIEVKKNFGYLDILLDRALEPEVYKRCNWHQFMQIFSLYKMKKSQQNHEIWQIRNKFNNEINKPPKERPQVINVPIRKTQINKTNLLRYQKKILYVTPVRNKPNQQNQALQNKKSQQKQNPFNIINISKGINESQFQEKKYGRNSRFKKDQNPSSGQKQKWKFQHDELIKPKKQSQLFEQETLSITKIIGLVLMLLIILALAQISIE